MEAKKWEDTVMTTLQLWAAYRKQPKKYEVLAAIEAQAEISFKAGQESRNTEIRELRIEVGSIAFEKGKKAGLTQGKKEQYIVDWEHEGAAVKQAKQEGRREVVEWINSNMALERCDPDVMAYFEDYHWIPRHIWQAKLKEWGLE